MVNCSGVVTACRTIWYLVMSHATRDAARRATRDARRATCDARRAMRDVADTDEAGLVYDMFVY